MQKLDIFIPHLFEYLIDGRSELGGRSHAAVRSMEKGKLEALGLQGKESVLWFLLYGQSCSEPLAGALCAETAAFKIRADPVCLEAGVRDVVVYPLWGGDQLSPDEALESEKAINGLLKDYGGEFRLGAHGEGFLLLETMPPLNSKPPGVLEEKGVRSLLDAGVFDPFWKRLFTEVQMILHNLDFNRQREYEGRAMVNGLWFWGAVDGSLERPLVQPDWVGGTDPSVGALFQGCFHNLKPHEPLRDECLQARHALIVAESLGEAHCGRVEGALGLSGLEWLASAITLLRRRELQRIRLMDETGLALSLNRRTLFAFWRRSSAFRQSIKQHLTC